MGSILDDAKEFDGRERFRIPTGIPGLDKLIRGGLKPGSITILGAEPGAGKTALVLHMARHAAEAGVPSFIASLEMDKHELEARILSAYLREGGKRHSIPFDDIEKKWGELPEDARSRASSGAIIQIKNPEEINPSDQEFSSKKNSPVTSRCIFENAEKWREELNEGGKLKKLEGDLKSQGGGKAAQGDRSNLPILIFVDYLQMIQTENDDTSPDERHRMNKVLEELQEVRSSYRNMALVLVSTLSRGGYSRVDMSSFKETGGIEYSADLLLGLESTGGGKSGARQSVRLKVIKNRSGVVTGEDGMPLDFYGAYAYFDARRSDEETAGGKRVVVDGFRYDNSNTGMRLLRQRNLGDTSPIEYQDEYKDANDKTVKTKVRITFEGEGLDGAFDMAVAEAIYTLYKRHGKKGFSTPEIFKTLRGWERGKAGDSQNKAIASSIKRLEETQVSFDGGEKAPFLGLSEKGTEEGGHLVRCTEKGYRKYSLMGVGSLLPLIEFDESRGHCHAVPRWMLNVPKVERKNEVKQDDENASTGNRGNGTEWDEVKVRLWLIRRLEMIRRNEGKAQLRTIVIGDTKGDPGETGRWIAHDLGLRQKALKTKGGVETAKDAYKRISDAVQDALDYYKTYGYISGYEPLESESANESHKGSPWRFEITSSVRNPIFCSLQGPADQTECGETPANPSRPGSDGPKPQKQPDDSSDEPEGDHVAEVGAGDEFVDDDASDDFPF